ncbi:MAG: hypothetical protein NVS2B12_27200 [Ktedonobacteraceae bacterium]
MSSEEPRYLGHYRLQECLAYGGMGEVWKALDTKLDRTVAIKLLRSEWRSSADFVARFKSEAQLIASLHHPNIVKIHNFYVSEDAEAPLMYMVMDYVQGQTLADYIRKTSSQGQFPSSADVVHIFTVVGLALDYAYARNMIHRDIKPANILLDQRLPNARPMGEPILSDFGIARRQGVSSGTIVGSIVGTPMYVSPEQAQGNYDDKRSDLYSLGIILYEMMTGVTPFRNAAPMALLVQHIYEQPTQPELINQNISPELSAVILKSIAKKPEERFPTASALSLALAQALHVPTPEILLQQNMRSGSLNNQPSLSYIPHVPGNSSIPGALQALSVPSHPRFLPNAHNSSPSLPQESQSRVGQPRSTSGATSLTTGPTYLQNGMLSSIPSTTSSANASITPPSAAVPTRGRLASFARGKWLIALIACLVVLVAGVSAAAFWSSSQQSNVVVGQIHFSSSGLPAKQYDTLQIDIQHAASLPAGKVYVAWIDQASNESNHPHWQLQLSRDNSIHMAHLTYAGFNNLLLANSLFVITMQDEGTSPLVPSASPTDRIYYALIGKQPSAALDIQHCPTGSNATTCF